MKKFGEFLTESKDDAEKWLEQNRGREGKTALKPDGKEIPNSVYLGGHDYAYKDGNQVKVIVYNERKGSGDPLYLKKEWISLLVKLK